VPKPHCLYNDKLQEIKTDLAVNGKQTKEKRLVIAEFAKETTYDEENLLSMSKENIKVVLEKRGFNNNINSSIFHKNVSCLF
jgi:hypothetical protein